MLGQEISVLIDRQLKEAGEYGVTWDGRNHLGREVSNGVYVYLIKTNHLVISKKLLLMK